MLVTFKTTNNIRLLRTETLDGQEYKVYPVAMSKEGVHNGSQGPLLYTAEELSSFVSAWNNKPIIVNHPKDENGEYCSCNLPVVVDTQVIGRTFNASFDAKTKRLKGEMWLKTAKTNKLYPGLFGVLNNKEAQVDVSTGVMIEVLEESGTWNGEDYIGIAQNSRPDHLAIISGGAGACSWEDGCGVRNKAKEEKQMPKKEEKKFCCEDRAKELIANSSGLYDDNDLAWMTAMSKDQYEKFEKTTLAPKKEKPAVNKKEKIEVKEEVPVKKSEPVTLEAFMKSVPTEIQGVFNEAFGALKSQREALTEKILAVNGDVFTKEELTQKPVSELRKLATFAESTVPQKEDPLYAFFGNTGIAPTERKVVSREEPLEIPTLNFDEEGK